MHPLTKAIPRFIQIVSPLPLLKPMVQSQRGAEERHVRAFVPPLSGSPHVAIEPSALRAAKALEVE
jgi:hypothetical protein